MEETVMSDLELAAQALYGDAAFEVVKALDPAKKEKRDRAMTNIALGTNAVGAVAGPAALGLAWRSRKEGGTPRAYARPVARAMQGRNKPRPVRVAGMKTQKLANTLNRPGGRKARIAAGAAGATLVGLQGINWGGDILSAKIINDQKKKDAAARVSKRSQQVLLPEPELVPVPLTEEPKKVRLVRLGTAAALEGAKKAPIVAAKAKRQVTKSATDMDVHWQGEISKMDEDKRQVFGWASIVEVDGQPVVDLQGDMMTVEEIEKAAYDYVLKSRKGGHQHEKTDEGPRHVSDLVESFLVTPEKKAQMGLPDSVPTGWWVGFQINDDEVWKSVKAGKLPGFSIHGSGVRKQVEV